MADAADELFEQGVELNERRQALMQEIAVD